MPLWRNLPTTVVREPREGLWEREYEPSFSRKSEVSAFNGAVALGRARFDQRTWVRAAEQGLSSSAGTRR